MLINYYIGNKSIALIDPESICALCGTLLGDEEIIGFSDIPVMYTDFYKLLDSAAHCKCLDAWDKKDAFVAYYNSITGNHLRLIVSAQGRVSHEEI